jgi:hypothetical protein
LLISEILNGIGAIVGIVAALTGGDIWVAAGSEFMKGVISGVAIAVTQNTATAADETLQNPAQLEG